MKKKICLLITGKYRDFIYSYNNTKSFFEFEKINYDIFFLIAENENIEFIKNEIKQTFGDNIKYLHNIFDEES
jgi:predicted transglutaminase-like protease